MTELRFFSRLSLVFSRERGQTPASFGAVAMCAERVCSFFERETVSREMQMEKRHKTVEKKTVWTKRCGVTVWAKIRSIERKILYYTRKVLPPAS